MRLFVDMIGCLFVVVLQAQNGSLEKADSLFNQQKYTEALAAYEEVYSLGSTSDAMLLKMAFIHDGLGNYPEALLFLDKYYLNSADRKVVGKIEELAEANELKGFRYNDTHYFSALLEKYRFHLTLVILLSALAMMIYIMKKSRQGERPLAAGVLQIFLVALVLIINNVESSEKAIIMTDDTLLRSGPSAGAEPVESIAKGHKVKVLTYDDVWVKILWQGEEVFVRRARVERI